MGLVQCGGMKHHLGAGHGHAHRLAVDDRAHLRRKGRGQYVEACGRIAARGQRAHQGFAEVARGSGNEGFHDTWKSQPGGRCNRIKNAPRSPGAHFR